jgi:flagellar export protein FliJ
MKFKFNLQNILNLRELETQEAERRVEFVKNVIAELKNMMIKERDCYFEEREALNIQVKESKLDNVKIFEKSLAIRQGRIMELLDNLRTCQNDLELNQQTLIQSRRKQKILENLKAAKEKEFVAKENRKEQMFLDEIATQKFVRAHQTKSGEE